MVLRLYERVFTRADIVDLHASIRKKWKFFSAYVPKGSKMLDCKCGCGEIAIPLSRCGYPIVGIDTDKNALKVAKINAQIHGHNIAIYFGDVFRPPSRDFDACISADLLERFYLHRIRNIIQAQLKAAPIAINIVKVSKKNENLGETFIENRMYNLWRPEFWINTVLEDFSVIDSQVFGDELCVIVGR